MHCACKGRPYLREWLVSWWTRGRRLASLALMQCLRHPPPDRRTSRVAPSPAALSAPHTSQQPAPSAVLVREPVDWPSPELGSPCGGGHVPGLLEESRDCPAAGAPADMDADMLTQWWYRVRPRVDEARRSRASVACAVDSSGAVDAAVAGTPEYLPELLEAVATTAVFDFGAYFGGYLGANSGSGEENTWHGHRPRRSTGRRKRSTRCSIAPGDVGAAGRDALPRLWLPVRMGALAAAEFLGEEGMRECGSCVGGTAGGASGGTVMSVAQQLADAETMQPPDARRLRRLLRVVRQQREQMVAVSTAGVLVGRLEAWLQLARTEVSEAVWQCQRLRAWLQDVFQMLGLRE